MKVAEVFVAEGGAAAAVAVGEDVAALEAEFGGCGGLDCRGLARHEFSWICFWDCLVERTATRSRVGEPGVSLSFAYTSILPNGRG